MWEQLAELQTAAHADWPDPDPGPVTPVLAADIERRFTGPQAQPELVFIAADGARYVGYSGLERRADRPGEVWSTGTAVHPAYRNRGVATALKVAALQRAQAQGYRLACTASGNPTLLRINERLGYRPTFTEVRLVTRLEPVANK